MGPPNAAPSFPAAALWLFALLPSRRLMSAFSLAAMAVCSSSMATASPTAPARLYIGYYVEDAANNPEDPTVGGVLLKVPPHGGRFSGLMPFSFIGCEAGMDIGTVGGTRVGTDLRGEWKGKVDGAAVGGRFGGRYDAGTDRISGDFDNAAGKTSVDAGDCSYFVAARGSYTLLGSAGNIPSSFTATLSEGARPRISWPSLGREVYYRVQVFDENCVLADPADASCFKGEALTERKHADFPGDFPLSRPLTLPGPYLILLTAIDGGTGQMAGFSALRAVLSPNLAQPHPG